MLCATLALLSDAMFAGRAFFCARAAEKVFRRGSSR
jgi:hypothetical protein